MSHVYVVPRIVGCSRGDPHETHRVATPLELFFDLVFVVAIASAAAQWHHGIAEGHLGDLLNFVIIFFAIWWAWMNYTWFASSYDCDDVPYRLLTFTIMAGSLLLAAGIPELFDTGQSGLVVGGYAVMRFAMVAMWLRAEASHPQGRSTALAYAVGITFVQAGIGRLLLDGRTVLLVSFFVLVVLELLVPIVAERRGITPFHPHHIAERYALLTLIVLGEVILASVQAVQGALGQGAESGLLALVVGGLLIVFSMWWLYFKRDVADLFEGTIARTFVTGYGHSRLRLGGGHRRGARRGRRPRAGRGAHVRASHRLRARRSRGRLLVVPDRDARDGGGSPAPETGRDRRRRGRPGRRDPRAAHRRHRPAHRSGAGRRSGPPRLVHPRGRR